MLSLADLIRSFFFIFVLSNIFFQRRNNTKMRKNNTSVAEFGFFPLCQGFFLLLIREHFKRMLFAKKKSNIPHNNIAIYSTSFGPCQPKSSHFSFFFHSTSAFALPCASYCLLSVSVRCFDIFHVLFVNDMCTML